MAFDSPLHLLLTEATGEHWQASAADWQVFRAALLTPDGAGAVFRG